MWYASSALTNTSSKSILNAFDKPATLTLIQFAFVSFYCIFLAWLASLFPRLKSAIPALKHGIRYPTADVIKTTLPLAAFQIGGHLLSSTATSKIPVSLVHTIKGLSPLFTVFAYRAFFNIRYPTTTYLSLIPLTSGVMLACSGKHGFAGHFLGIVYALLATVIFVTQNIFSKRLFNEAKKAEAEGVTTRSKSLDKLNLLCYSSGLAFLITGPIWFWSEGMSILGDFLYDGSVDLIEGPGTFDHGRLFVEFVFNGTFHFGQNILAFVLLSMVSPVTYSVASLLKRVFVIVIAILWFRSPTTNLQAVGIALTFFGLYLYDRTKESKADRKASTLTEIQEEPLLPLNTRNVPLTSQSTTVFESPAQSAIPHPYTNGYAIPLGDDSKKSDDLGRGRTRKGSNAGWRPPGTRQEDTWRAGDKVVDAA
jgi:solute carrier family 35, member E1